MQRLLPLILILLSLECFSQKLVSVSPNKARNGESLTIEIIGENLDFTSSTPAVYLSLKKGSITKYIFANSRNAASPTVLYADFQMSTDTLVAPIGIYDVCVAGFGTLAKSFEICQPQLNKISPSRALPNQTIEVTISGLNTRFTQGTNSIYLSHVIARLNSRELFP